MYVIMCSMSIPYIMPLFSCDKSYKNCYPMSRVTSWNNGRHFMSLYILIERIAATILFLRNHLRNCSFNHVQTVLKISCKNTHKIFPYVAQSHTFLTQSCLASWRFHANAITTFFSIKNRQINRQTDRQSNGGDYVIFVYVYIYIYIFFGSGV